MIICMIIEIAPILAYTISFFIDNFTCHREMNKKVLEEFRILLYGTYVRQGLEKNNS